MRCPLLSFERSAARSGRARVACGWTQGAGGDRGGRIWHTASMRIEISTYIPGSSPVHACDARVKVVLLVAYSITLFLVETWWALGVCAVAFAALLGLSRIAPRRVFALSVPLLVIAAFAIVFNAFSFDASAAGAAPGGLGAVSAGWLEGAPSVLLAGSFGFVPAGFARGCFYAVRIVLLVVASLLVSFSTTSTELTAAFSSFLRPLRALRVPVDDVASVLSVALRFIPLVAEELGRIHDAQWSRGAKFGEDGLVTRLRAWATVLVPLFVSMFRRADALAVAMDARCYGMPGIARTSLDRRRMTAGSLATLAAGLAACAALAVLG